MKLDVRLEQIRSCIVLKDAIAKNFVANEHHSFTSVFTFSVVVVDLPTDRILTFLFLAETDVLVPVFSQATDVVVVNFVVVLKFPNICYKTATRLRSFDFRFQLHSVTRHKMARLTIVAFIAFYCVRCIIFEGKKE